MQQEPPCKTGMDVELTINAAGLAPGSYSAKVTVAGTGKGTNYTSADYCVNLTVVPAGTLEAEDAVLSNVDVETNHAGYTGRGFADYVDSSDDYIEWTINKSGANSTMLQFRYANGSKINRPLKLEVNGDVVNASLSFPPTGDWSNWSDVSVLANLKDGINKISCRPLVIVAQTLTI